LRPYPIVLFSLLLLWITAALYIDRKRDSLEKEYQERSRLVGRYHALKEVWSEKAQKKAAKRFETMLRLYGIRPEVTRKTDRKIYDFELDAKQVDTVLNKLLNSTLAIETFEARRKDDHTLHVKTGVSP
jgi:hypothetical protein